MRNKTICCVVVFVFLSLFSSILFAWDNSIEIGYGYSHDPNHTKYHNSGFLLSGDIVPLYHSFWTYWSIGGALGKFRTTAPQNKNLTTVAVTLGTRLYPFSWAEFPPYLLASSGPAWMSSRHFGLNTQGSNFAFQSNFGVGIEIYHIDLNLRLEHFSNAGLKKPNEGFNILYLLSFGYLF